MSFIKRRKRNGKIYLEEVENIRINGKVVQKHLKYIGREVDGEKILSSNISDISVEKVKLFGPLIALDSLAKEINLEKILGSYGKEILSLVYAHCLDYKSINKMENWFSRTDLNFILNLNDLTESRLLKALDSINGNNIEELQKSIFAEVKDKLNIGSSGVVYDVTNTYLYGKKCELGKEGHDKENVKGRPLIQIGLAVTKDEGIPIFHKTFSGNISDSRTLHDMLTNIDDYKIKNGFLIYDRGIVSSKNVKEASKKGWETICGLPSNEKLKAITKRNCDKKELITISNRVKINKSVFYIFESDLKLGETDGTLLICYNEQKEKDLRESRYDEILNAKELLTNDEEIKEGLQVYFNKNKTINKIAIAEAEEFDGFSYIFSTKKLPKEKVLELYFQDKDIVEKAFQSLKGVVTLRPIRHWLYDRVTAHVFICYLSYLLLTMLKLKTAKLKISPVDALQELSTVYKVYLKDKKKNFELSKTVVLNKKQEKILNLINKKLLKECSG